MASRSPRARPKSDRYCRASRTDIAKRFSISEQTVKHHLGKILQVGVTNRLELALFSVQNQMVAKRS
jgi:hypothetical protein